jgi:hypothetical protein
MNFDGPCPGCGAQSWQVNGDASFTGTGSELVVYARCAK